MKKEWKYYLITAAITTVLVIFLYTQLDAFQNTIFISDSYSQYVALFTKLKNILQSGESLIYSFQGGLGNEFLGTFFYYLSSPFNLLIIFFEDMEKFLLTITLLKFIVISLTSLYFFRYHFPKENSIYAITFSIIYTFISYNILHFIHIMWLDAVLMLPLLLVGIDKFIKKKKILPYVLPLIYIIFTNYYLGYMSCIFSFLYFNYQIFIKYSIKKEWKKILKENGIFLIVSFLAILATSFVLLEVVHYLPGYARTTTEFLNGEEFIFHGNPFHFFQNFFISSTINVDFLNDSDFFLYNSVLAFLLISLYFTNSKITRKEKVLTLLMIIILYISVSGNYFNYMWHGFSKPQFFNGRFTFLFDFFLLYISIKSLYNLKYLKPKSYIISSIFFLIILYVFYFTTKETTMMYGNLGLLIVYSIALLTIRSEKIYIPLVLVTIVILEITSNAILELDKYSFTTKQEYTNQNIIYHYAINYIKDYDDSPFYRVENSDTVPYNGPIYYQYNGIDIFLSTLSDDMANFFFDFGLGSGATKKNTISYYSGYEITDTLFGIRYHIYIDDYEESEHYKLLLEKELKDSTLRIYENPNALSLGFMVNSKILEVEKDLNALSFQNEILKAMTNSNDSIYIPIPLEQEQNSYYFENTEYEKDICFYTAIDSSNGYNNPSLYLDGHLLDKRADFEIVCTESPYSNELYLSYSNLDDTQHLGTFAAYYNKDAWNSILNNLKEQEFTIQEYKGNKIKGTVTSTTEKNILFTTIPYDENWEVFVDGKKVNTLKLLDGLLGVELKEGVFTIEFQYKPKQFHIGMIVSIISFFILFIIGKKKLLQTK